MLSPLAHELWLSCSMEHTPYYTMSVSSVKSESRKPVKDKSNWEPPHLLPPSPIYSLINLSRNTHFIHPCPRGKDLKLPFSSFKSIGGKNPSYDFIYLHNNITAERKLHNENKLLVIFWCLKEVKIQERLEFPWKLLALGNSTKPC